ncbi:MAG: thiolase [Tistrella sp.]|mgnify:FL=1|nr:thiolase [Tistrella sp.]MAD35998.1 thiolase [Tistrella sp.]MBA77488.1 thiolase [Tistrella sp.]
MSLTHPLASIVGAAETTRLGVLPDMSELDLHADAALNALADCGLAPGDIDGIATAGENPAMLAQYLGITPTWVDATNIGGCSFMTHVAHAAAAIRAGLCRTVLITHGESGRSRVGHVPWTVPAHSLMGQFELGYTPTMAATLFTLPALRYMKAFGVTEEDLARVTVVQRQWAGFHPRAFRRDPVTVDEVLASRMIAWPFRILMCCLVTDGGGALVLTAPDRAADFPTRPVDVIGTGESVEHLMITEMKDYTSSRAFRVAGDQAFAAAGIDRADVDHLMIYDAFAHVPLYGLEALGFVKPGEAAGFIADGHTAPGGRLPMNTNGGGINYMHSGMYGMYALQEAVRQMRGTAPEGAQVRDARISVVQGVGGMFGTAGTVILARR